MILEKAENKNRLEVRNKSEFSISKIKETKNQWKQSIYKNYLLI